MMAERNNLGLLQETPYNKIGLLIVEKRIICPLPPCTMMNIIS
jgi:hypothetical protein